MQNRYTVLSALAEGLPCRISFASSAAYPKTKPARRLQATINAEGFCRKHGFRSIRRGYFSHGLGGEPIEIVHMESMKWAARISNIVLRFLPGAVRDYGAAGHSAAIETNAADASIRATDNLIARPVQRPAGAFQTASSLRIMSVCRTSPFPSAPTIPSTPSGS